MFTGLVDHCGRLIDRESFVSGQRWTIAMRFQDLVLGESIAVNGCCLTVTEFGEDWFICELSPETLSVTGLGVVQLGDQLNLERALRLSDRLGGHWLLGHVDACLTVIERSSQGGFTEFVFAGVQPAHQAYLVPKGCIGINGVSLTLNTVSADRFSVMCIPKTLELSNLGALSLDAMVNVEYDYLAKLVQKQVIS